MKELRKLISKEIKKALAETYAKPSDMEKIEDFIMSAPEFESISPTKLKKAVKEMYEEWKTSASNYNTIEEYFEEIEQTGGLEGFLPENTKPMDKTKTIVKRLKEDTAYQEFFKKAMDKFKINTPADLKDPVRKKEFFDYIDKNYKAKDEMTEGTQLMSNPEVKSKVEMIINTLKDIDVDGETMQYILEQVGMDEQMLHQLTPGGIREGKSNITDAWKNPKQVETDLVNWIDGIYSAGGNADQFVDVFTRFADYMSDGKYADQI